MNNSPYPIHPPGHLSATGISVFCTCEAQEGYRRLFKGIPTLPTPSPMVFGVAAHKLIERLGKIWWGKISRDEKIPDRDVGKALQYARLYIGRCMPGTLIGDIHTNQHGPRGESDHPIAILWKPTPARRKGEKSLDAREYAEQQIEAYQGKIYNILMAIYLEMAQFKGLADLEFEYSFVQDRVLLPADSGPGVKIDGQIDQILTFNDGRIFARDFKTGYVVREYEKRRKLVEDIQMTVYYYAIKKAKSVWPTAMFIQPLEFSTEFLKEHGSKTLQILRKRTDRTSDHVQDLALLASDINQIVNALSQSSKGVKLKLDGWEPRSNFGKKAGLAENLNQMRLVPRVGPWCTNCLYIQLCEKDHLGDWQAYQNSADMTSHTQGVLPLVRDLQSPDPSPQLDLFENRTRITSLPKGLRQVRKELVESGHFLTSVQIRGSVVTKLTRMLRVLGLCPCLQARLTPLWLLDGMRSVILRVSKACGHSPILPIQ